jgi:O-acetyl-ADP-ribose deacetylase (regulator of RNase III)
LARIELWNGDICDLEVDAIVNPANLSLWMSTGVSGAIKRAGGDAIEFAAVRQAPVPLGEAIVTPAGSLAARAVIHAVSLDRDRRTSGPRHRSGRPKRDGPCARDRRDERGVSRPRHRRRRLPAR